MRDGSVTPSGVERFFDDDEIIVSKTDQRGFLTYVNPVFLRVSAYDEGDVIGKPHNVIRHPDMPRAIFKLLWDTISRGDELFAYVVNLAGDGAHYWVHAHVTPSFGADGSIIGYHSNRRVPDRSAVRQVEALYERLRAEERRHAKPTDAMRASTAMLDDTLRSLSTTYDEFVWSLGRKEVQPA